MAKINKTVAQIEEGLRPYKVYTALLTQTGTNAPVATVLENTIGNIVWTRASFGTYFGTLTGVFTLNKTAIFISNPYSYGNLANTGISVQPASTDYVEVNSFRDGSLLDSILGNPLINTVEIRIYS